MDRAQTRHDLQRDQRLDILRHLAGHHDRVDRCGDRPVEKSRCASASVIFEARSSHHRRRRRNPDSPRESQPSRSGAVVTDVPIPRSQIRHRCRICLATAAGVPVILNPSPLTSEFIQTRVKVDTYFVQEFVQE